MPMTLPPSTPVRWSEALAACLTLEPALARKCQESTPVIDRAVVLAKAQRIV